MVVNARVAIYLELMHSIATFSTRLHTIYSFDGPLAHQSIPDKYFPKDFPERTDARHTVHGGTFDGRSSVRKTWLPDYCTVNRSAWSTVQLWVAQWKGNRIARLQSKQLQWSNGPFGWFQKTAIKATAVVKWSGRWVSKSVLASAGDKDRFEFIHSWQTVTFI